MSHAARHSRAGRGVADLGASSWDRRRACRGRYRARTTLFPQGNAGSSILPICSKPSRHVDAAEDLLTRVAVELRGVARLEQPWLGLGDAPIRSQRAGPVRRLDATGGMVGVAPTHHERAYSLEGPGPTVSVRDLEGFGNRFGTDGEDDVTRGLLSDARYLATWQEPPNLQRALLLAAVACEVQAKRVLQRKASPPRDPSRSGCSRINDPFLTRRSIFTVRSPSDSPAGHSTKTTLILTEHCSVCLR